MSARINPRLLLGALVFFAVAALLGAGFALLGPVKLVRLFGTIALVGGAAGCALQLYALRTFAPHAYRALRTRLVAVRERTAASAEGVPALASAR